MFENLFSRNLGRKFVHFRNLGYENVWIFYNFTIKTMLNFIQFHQICVLSEQFDVVIHNSLSVDLPFHPITLSIPHPQNITPSLWQWWIWQQDSVNDIGPRGDGGRTSRAAFAFPFITPAFITARRVPGLIKVPANEGGAGKQNTGQKLGTKPN